MRKENFKDYFIRFQKYMELNHNIKNDIIFNDQLFEIEYKDEYLYVTLSDEPRRTVFTIDQVKDVCEEYFEYGELIPYEKYRGYLFLSNYTKNEKTYLTIVVYCIMRKLDNLTNIMIEENYRKNCQKNKEQELITNSIAHTRDYHLLNSFGDKVNEMILANINKNGNGPKKNRTMPNTMYVGLDEYYLEKKKKEVVVVESNDENELITKIKRVIKSLDKNQIKIIPIKKMGFDSYYFSLRNILNANKIATITDVNGFELKYEIENEIIKTNKGINFSKDDFKRVASLMFEYGLLKHLYCYDGNLNISNEENTYLLPICHYIISKKEKINLDELLPEEVKKLLFNNNDTVDEVGEELIEEPGEEADDNESIEEVTPIEAEEEIDETIYIEDDEEMFKDIECSIDNDADSFINSERVFNIFIHPKLKSFISETTKEIQDNFNHILKKIDTLPKDKLFDFFKQKKAKKFLNTRYNLYKLYANNNGHRIIYCYGNDLKDDLYKDSIIFLFYVDKHDMQGKIARKIKPEDIKKINARDASHASKFIDEFVSQGINSKKEYIPPYRYNNNEYIPELSANQKEHCNLLAPALLKGSAGSGKTIISMAIYKKMFEKDPSTVYLTYSKELVIYVKDCLKKSIVSDKIDKDKLIEHVYTINQFMRHVLGYSTNEHTYVEYHVFKDWKKDYYKSKKKYLSINDFECWTYIRGEIKGNATGNKPLTINEFRNWMQKNENKDSIVAENIYQIFLDYEKYIEKSGNKGDNDYAFEVLNKNINTSINCAIIDEVQDLTQTQIRALIKMVKNGNIFYFGDTNQIVQPTILDLDSIQSLYINMPEQYKRFKKRTLKNTYRSCKDLIKYINYLSDLRKKYIAYQDIDDDEYDKSLRDDIKGMFAIRSLGDEQFNLKICEMSKEANNIVIVVPDTSSKEKILAYDNSLVDHVKYIDEIKGIEYEDIVIYNFYTYFKDKFKIIFDGNARKNTFARLVFNYLYVACTRAKDRILVLEDEFDDNCDLLYHGIEDKSNLDDIKVYLNLNTSKEGWERLAKDNVKYENYNSAKNCYSRINDNGEYDDEIEMCDQMSHVQSIHNYRAKGDQIASLVMAAEKLIKLKRYDYALIVYNMLNKIDPNVYYSEKFILKLIENEEIEKNEFPKAIESITSEGKLSRYLYYIERYYVKKKVEENKKLIYEIKRLTKERK